MTIAKITEKSPSEDIVHRYFDLIRALRSGDESSVEGLMELWDPEGTFEFAGAPPTVGSFKGALAIRTLYKNRLKSSGMALQVETRRGKPEDVTLGIVDTDVKQIRKDGQRVLVGWRTTIGTGKEHGFDVGGSHVFTFKGGKIKKLRVTVAPKATRSHLEDLSLEALSVADVGRLSLAAWAVV